MKENVTDDMRITAKRAAIARRDGLGMTNKEFASALTGTGIIDISGNLMSNWLAPTGQPAASSAENLLCAMEALKISNPDDGQSNGEAPSRPEAFLPTDPGNIAAHHAADESEAIDRMLPGKVDFLPDVSPPFIKVKVGGLDTDQVKSLAQACRRMAVAMTLGLDVTMHIESGDFSL